MRSIDKVTQKVMLVQKEKGGIVGKWLREQGRHEAVYELTSAAAQGAFS